MMSVCPHCRQPSVAPWAVRWSSREQPASCASCGGLSHALSSTRSGIPALSCIILGFFFLLGTQVHQMGWAWLGVPLAIAYNLWAWRRVKLVPITQGRAVAARRAAWLVHLLAVLGVFMR